MAQNQPFTCGIDAITAKKLITDSVYRAFAERVKPQINKALVDTTTLITIPVVFVVYHLGEPVGAGSNVSVADLQNQINLMNQTYAGSRPTYGGVDTRIRFTLARRSPSCGVFSGIARVDARSVTGYEANGLDTWNWQMATSLRALAPDFQNVAAERFVVVRVMHRISGATGWASAGGDITVSAATMQNANVYNNVLTHEMGHVLYLSHTFDGAQKPNGCPINNNPLTEGDLVADTDPHRQSEPVNACSASSESETNPCTGKAFGLIGRNHMSYGCNPVMFTAGQKYRMRSYLANGLQTLATSLYGTPLTPADIVAPVSCSISVTQRSINYTGITEFQLQGIRKKSGYPIQQSNYYQDYSCQERTVLTAGQSYSLSLSANGRFRKVYIDYNNDGSFSESTELAWFNEASTTNLITVPNTAVTGQFVRMRVVVDESSQQPTACFLYGSTYGAGEIEDYAVQIVPANTPQSLSIAPLNTVYMCRGQQTTLPIVTVGVFSPDNVFTVQLSDATGSFANPSLIGTGTASPVALTLPATSILGEDYRLRVLSSNPLLVSESVAIAIEAPVSATLIPASLTFSSPQAVSLVVSLSGRPPYEFSLLRNGAGWASFGLFSSPQYTYSFTPTSSSIFTMGSVSNGCGPGLTYGQVSVSLPCSPPANLTETNQTTYSFRAEWDYTEGTTYTFQWKESSASTWNEVNTGNTDYSIYSLLFGETYIWRVRRNCSDGPSAWSVERTFTVGCYTPHSLQEISGLTTALIWWSYMGGSVQYSVRWRPIGTTIWNETGVLPSTYHSLTGLTESTTYEWQARSRCTDGSITDWSAARQFITQCSTPMVSSWSTYLRSLQVSFNGAPNTPHRYRYRLAGSTNWIVSDTTTLLSYVSIRNLSPNNRYEFQIQAVCSTTSSSAWSQAWTASLECFQPYSPYVAAITPTTAQIAWGNRSNEYIYDLRWRLVGSSIWTDVSSLTTAYATLTGLTTAAIYEVQVRSVCSSTVVTAYTSSLTFSPSCPIPSANQMWMQWTGSTSAKVTWDAVTNVNYQLQWRVLGETNWQSTPSVQSYWAGAYSPNALTGLTNGTTYEWRVLSFCQGMETPNSSPIARFTTGCYVVNISGNIPESASAWIYLYGPTDIQYRFRWRPVGTTTWVEGISSSTSYRITGLAVDVTYEYQVQAICSTTQTSPYSVVNRFKTQCSIPTNLSVYNVTIRSASFNWNSRESQFTFRWRAAGTTDWTTVSSLTTTTYSLTGLVNGTPYEWQVRAACSTTAEAGYVSGASFTPNCPVATDLTETYISNRYAQFRWYAVANQPYVVQWRVVGASTWVGAFTVTQGYTGNYYTSTFPGFVPNTPYEWQVLSNCEGILSSSVSRTFVTQCLPPNGLNYYNVLSRGASLNWGGLSGLAGVAYRVRWRPAGTTAWTESNATANTSMPLTSLTINTAYEWQVQTLCDGTGGDYSTNGPSFTTTCPSPLLNTATPTDINTLLTWSSFVGETMNLRYRQINSTTWTTVTSLTTSSYNLTGLTPNTNYEWQVTISCTDGQTTFSPTGRFSTLASCDLNEPNNTYLTTTVLPVNTLNYTSPDLCLNVTSDEDWFRWQIDGQVYYIRVYSYAFNSTGLYRLRLEVIGNLLRVKTIAPGTASGTQTDTFIQLYAANGTTLLDQNDDANGTVFSEIARNLPPFCINMFSLKPGSWTDPSVWSCSRVPTNTDAVQVLHEVSMPVSTVGNAGRVSYGAGGKLIMNTGAKLMLGQ